MVDGSFLVSVGLTGWNVAVLVAIPPGAGCVVCDGVAGCAGAAAPPASSFSTPLDVGGLGEAVGMLCVLLAARGVAAPGRCVGVPGLVVVVAPASVSGAPGGCSLSRDSVD